MLYEADRAKAALSHPESPGKEARECYLKSLESFYKAFVSESCGKAK